MDSFANETISTHSLPDIKAVPTELISLKYRASNMAVTLLISALFFGILLALSFFALTSLPKLLQDALPYIALFALIITLCCLIYEYLAGTRIRYALRQNDLTLKKGVIFKKVTCQPMLRIQHVEVKQGPVDRLVGLTKLHVYSAGGAAHTFLIPGLPQDTAEKLRAYILEHKDLNIG